MTQKEYKEKLEQVEQEKRELQEEINNLKEDIIEKCYLYAQVSRLEHEVNQQRTWNEQKNHLIEQQREIIKNYENILNRLNINYNS